MVFALFENFPAHHICWNICTDNKNKKTKKKWRIVLSESPKMETLQFCTFPETPLGFMIVIHLATQMSGHSVAAVHGVHQRQKQVCGGGGWVVPGNGKVRSRCTTIRE